VAIESIFKHIK